jgi:hypothetical protein
MSPSLEQTSRRIAALTGRGLFWLFWGPITLAITLAKIHAAYPMLSANTIGCVTCGDEISLLGSWECGRCGYSWYGFYFAACAVCGDVPGFIACERCGASTLNPLIL